MPSANRRTMLIGADVCAGHELCAQSRKINILLCFFISKIKRFCRQAKAPSMRSPIKTNNQENILIFLRVETETDINRRKIHTPPLEEQKHHLGEIFDGKARHVAKMLCFLFQNYFCLHKWPPLSRTWIQLVRNCFQWSHGPEIFGITFD